MEQEQFDVAIIGGGPAVQYFMLAADVIGKLDNLTKRRIAVIDPLAFQGGHLAQLSPAMSASVPPSDFLEKFPNSPKFSSLLDTLEAQNLRGNGDRFPTFGTVVKFLQIFGEKIRRVLEEGHSEVKEETATHIVYDSMSDEARYTVHTKKGTDSHKLTASKLILATGIEEKKPDLGQNNSKVIYSSDILTERGLAEIRKFIQENPQETIVIMGGGSSAFAVADMLKDDLQNDGQLIILHRNDIKANVLVEDAELLGVKFTQDDIANGQVYPHAGIKEARLKLWREIVEEREKRIILRKFSDFEEVQSLIDKAGRIVSAIGQKAKTVKIYGPDGKEIGPVMTENRLYVDKRARIKITSTEGHTTAINYGFALGAGHSPAPRKGIGLKKDIDKNAAAKPLDAILSFATIDALAILVQLLEEN